ncbi:uncharacterized protein EV422DRAFT_20090 [Fimicolochytrium jonesii]|uniref:uncharacterized protein n=1 Tax=Fimicolochytrium jonesii TaxID=1396493 RepID=UPI0022FEB21C|nr:uncharacterized protein EV422DRAFT_20090 [Fimicolochytrium jonesii]KAI8826982.1 hypothetical protein EV422DRAFT_20090 [Fimicolochytrium jonesii]
MSTLTVGISVLRLVSTLCALVVFVSYCVLPGKRKHPRIFVVYISGLVTVWQSLSASYIFGNEGKNVFCSADGVSSADYSNARCTVQGLGIVWLSVAATCWCFALILNLHLEVVWASAAMKRRHWILHLISWGLPTILVGLAIKMQAVQYLSRGLCSVNLEYEKYIVQTPYLVIGCSIWCVHTATTFWLWRNVLPKAISALRRSPRPSMDSNRELINPPVSNEEYSQVEPQIGETRHRRERSIPDKIPKPVTSGRRRGISDASETSTPEGDKPSFAGVQFVQIRLVVFATIVIGLVLAYALLYQKDLENINDMVRRNDGNKILDDLLTCVYDRLISSPQLTLGRASAECRRSIARQTGFRFPAFWRRLLAELILSSPGFIITFSLGWRLLPDWIDMVTDWKDQKRSAEIAQAPPGALSNSSVDLLVAPTRARASSKSSVVTGGGSRDIPLSTFTYSSGVSSSVLSTSASSGSPPLGRAALPPAVRSLGEQYSPLGSPPNSSLQAFLSSPSPAWTAPTMTIRTTNTSLTTIVDEASPADYRLGPLSASVSEREAFGPQFRPW